MKKKQIKKDKVLIENILKCKELLDKAPVPQHDRYIYDGRTDKTYYIK
jgi:hypothetical protein